MTDDELKQLAIMYQVDNGLALSIVRTLSQDDLKIYLGYVYDIIQEQSLTAISKHEYTGLMVRNYLAPANKLRILYEHNKQ